MKISKLLLLMYVVSVCAPVAFAQTARGLKYVPQAVKGAKAVPYVVKTNLSPVLRTNLAVPVVRPNVAAQVAPAVERAVAAKVTVQERLARLEKNLNALEEYARTHDNRLPSTFYSTGSSDLRWQIIKDISFLKKKDVLGKNHPLCKRYNQLVETDKQQRDMEEFESRLAREEERQQARLAWEEEQRQEKLARAEQLEQIKLAAAERRQKMVEQNRPIIARIESNLTLLEEYVLTHDNKLPPLTTSNFEASLLGQVYQDIDPLPFDDVEPLARRYNRLIRLYAEEKQMQEKQLARELKAQEQAAEERAWKQVLLQDKAWKTQSEEIADPAENADKAAALGEQQLSVPGTVTTDEYVNQLLRFYNKLDPWGMGTIQ